MLRPVDVATLRDMNPPLLVIVCGAAGSGKSTVARSMAVALGACHLDKDDLAPFVERLGTALPGWQGPSDRESETYRAELRPVEYQVLLDLAFSQLAVGCSVLLDAPLSTELRDEDWCQELAARVEAAGAVLRVVEVLAADEERHWHIAERHEARDANKLAHWEDYLAGLRHGELAIAHERIVNDQGLAELEEQALGLAGRWRARVGR